VVTYIPMPATEVELLELQVAAYDEGYDDALEGLSRRNAGDLQSDYDAGYDDGAVDLHDPSYHGARYYDEDYHGADTYYDIDDFWPEEEE
jgi:hypothetical protein